MAGEFDYVYALALIIACIFGWIDGGRKMKQAKNDPTIGIKPSKNLFTYLFIDY